MRAPANRRVDRWSSAWCLTLAALLLGFAIQLNLGRLEPGALFLLTLSIPLAVIGLIGPDWRAFRERNVRFAIAFALLVEFGLLFFWPPTIGDPFQTSGPLLPFRIGLLAAAPLAIFEVADRPTWRRVRMPILFGFWALAALWVLAVASPPTPTIDVWWFQQIGSRSLLEGISPYGIQMPNITGPGSPYYAPEVMVGDHLTVGLPYPPLSLLLTLPGYLLFGDVRYALLAAVLVAAGLIAVLRPGPVARGAALLFLFMPRGLFVVAQAWTEPLAVMLLALAVLMALRRWRLLPLALGLLIAVKQYLVVVLPMALLLGDTPRPASRVVRSGVAALAVALVVTLPLFAWDPGGFWRSLVTFQFQQPFRADALSYAAWLGLDNPGLAAILGFAAIVPAAALAVWRAARTPAGFAATVALVYLFFFAFNKQAFANYYYFVVGAMCCAIAATRVNHEPG